MTGQPLVSIVIPVYNGGNYLREAIDSALAQTWPNVEVLVINDGSDDGGETERIALSYGDRIRYISKENGGVATALNRGIREMRGEYFSWLSHDDLYHPEKVRKLVELQRQSTGDTLVLCDSMLVNERAEPLRRVPLPKELLADPILLVLTGAIDGCALLVPKAAFGQVGVFDERLRTTQDIDLWLRLARHGYSFLYLQEALSYSRVHDAQTTHTVSAAHRQGCSLFYQQAVADLEESYLDSHWRALAELLCHRGEAAALDDLLRRCARTVKSLERINYAVACRSVLFATRLRALLRKYRRKFF